MRRRFSSRHIAAQDRAKTYTGRHTFRDGSCAPLSRGRQAHRAEEPDIGDFYDDIL